MNKKIDLDDKLVAEEKKAAQATLDAFLNKINPILSAPVLGAGFFTNRLLRDSKPSFDRTSNLAASSNSGQATTNS